MPGRRPPMQYSRIFLIGDNDALCPMEARPYDAERVLQAHLASTPELLPGDQIDQENPRRWLLVRREAGVPCAKDGGDYWSLDHLFVDQDGIPTLVECKRSGDPRLRREVVAQMLDYAANGMEYWPEGKLRVLAEETAVAAGRSLAEALGELLQLDAAASEEEQDAFWAMADANLANGVLRLLFVADAIPRELRRIVEFLNAKTTDVEVLAVELKQFVNERSNLKAFVPRVIGQTEQNQSRKNLGKKKYESIEKQLCAYPRKEIFERIVDTARQHNHTVAPGITNFSLKCRLHEKMVTYAFGKPTGPSLQFYTEYLTPFPALKKDVEETLHHLGYVYNGKFTIAIDINDNADEVLTALTQVIAALDAYAAMSQ